MRLAESAQKLGLKTTVLNEADLKQLQPGLTMQVHGAVYFEDDAHVTTVQVMKALRHRVVARGAEIHDGVQITKFEQRGNAISRANEFTADEYVLATGAWSGQIARQLNLNLPMVAGKGYGLTVANPPESITIPAILSEARIAVTPMLDGIRFVGTFEVAKPMATPDNRRVEAMRRNVQDYYPSFTPTVLQGPAFRTSGAPPKCHT